MKKLIGGMQNGKKTPFPAKLALALILNTAVLFGTYCFFVMRLNINWIFWVYYGLLGAAALLYIVLNQGFAWERVTYDDLPATWSEEKKRELLFLRDERKRKSKWLLTLIFPLCLS